MKSPEEMFVVLDWGTTALRAALVSRSGRVVDRYEGHDGIQTVSPSGAFASILERVVARWRHPGRQLSIYASGMIGSRNGWIEVPYIPVPAGADALAQGARTIAANELEQITIFPGLLDDSSHEFPDVMRGEETQLVGLGLDRDGVVVLPGTHSKWARIEGGFITQFRTFVTGEIYATLLGHSFIAAPAKTSPTRKAQAFDLGLRTALRNDVGLLGTLFSTRSRWLLGQIVDDDIPDYLSGLVIGAEFIEARDMGWYESGDTITLIGRADLLDNYRIAADALGVAILAGPTDAALRGCLAMVRVIETAGRKQ
jgi:2-dehydro-3-deoxygalactonokinase